MDITRDLLVRVKFTMCAYHPDTLGARSRVPERLIHHIPLSEVPDMIRDLAARGWGHKEDDGVYIASMIGDEYLWPIMDFDAPHPDLIPDLMVATRELAQAIGGEYVIHGSGVKGTRYIPFFWLRREDIETFERFLYDKAQSFFIPIDNNIVDEILSKEKAHDLVRALRLYTSLLSSKPKSKSEKKRLRKLKESDLYKLIRKQDNKWHANILLFFDKISPHTPIAIIRNRKNGKTAQPLSDYDIDNLFTGKVTYHELMTRPFLVERWADYFASIINNLSHEYPEEFIDFLCEEKEKEEKKEKGKVISTTFGSIFTENKYQLRVSRKAQITKLIEKLSQKYSTPKLITIKGKIKGYQWKKCPICGHKEHSNKSQNFTIWQNGRYIKAKCFSAGCPANAGIIIDRQLLLAIGLTENEIGYITADDLNPNININQTHKIMPLGEARRVTKETIDRVIAERKDAIIAAGTGTGKTTAILANLPKLQGRGLTLIAFPTNDLAGEAFHCAKMRHPELASKMKLLKPKKVYCYHPHLLQKTLDLNLPENVVCAKCPHHPKREDHDCFHSKCKADKDKLIICEAFQQFSAIQNDSILFLTHDMLLYLHTLLRHLHPETYHYYQNGMLVIDETENFINKIVYQFNWKGIKKIYEFLNEYTPTTGISQFVDAVISIKRKVQNIINKREMITLDHTWPEYAFLKTKAEGALKGLLDAVANWAEGNPSLKNKADHIKALLWDIFIETQYGLDDDKTYSEIKNQIKEICFEAEINFDAFNLLFAILRNKILIHISSSQIYFTFRKKLTKEKLGSPQQTILLDATAHIPTVKSLFPWLDDPEELSLWPKRKGKIIQLKDTTSRKHLKRALSGDKAKERQVFYVLQMAKNLTSRGQTAWIAPNTFGKNENLMDIINQISNQMTYHFSSRTRGSNDFSSVANMVLLGSPVAPPIFYILVARTLLFDKRELEQSYRQWLPMAAYLQEIGRHRQLFNDTNALLVMINNKYPDEILNIIGPPDLCVHNPLGNPKTNKKLVNAYTRLISCVNETNIDKLQVLLDWYHTFLKEENTDNDPDFSNRMAKYLKTFYANNALLPAWKEAWEATTEHTKINENCTFVHQFLQLTGAQPPGRGPRNRDLKVRPPT